MTKAGTTRTGPRTSVVSTGKGLSVPFRGTNLVECVSGIAGAHCCL